MRRTHTLRRIGALAAALAMALALAGCGGNASGNTGGGTQTFAAESSAAMAAEAGPDTDALLQPDAESGRKIIYTAYLEIETQNYDAANETLRAALDEAGGHVEESSESGAQGERYARYVMRVPAAQYAAFLAAAGEAGSVVHQSEQAEDITREYVDTEARLETLRAQRDRLEELAGQAGTLEDLLTIEEHLADVQYQIESYTAQQRAMDDQVDLCTVEVTLREVALYSPSGSFGARLTNTLSRGWQNFVAVCQGFVLTLAYCLPLLAVAGAVAAVVIVCVRRHRKKHPKKPKLPPPPPPSPAPPSPPSGGR